MNDVNEMADRELVCGSIKWFDTAKGFGFILSDAGGPDILLHANVLRNFGQGSVADGARIEVYVIATARGRQAVDIVSIQQPESVGLALVEDISPEVAASIPSLPIEPARVKWFDKGKGFGFANVFGRSEDIFIHIEVLRQSGLAELQPAEAVGLRIIDGKRGRMAVQVLSWESALRV